MTKAATREQADVEDDNLEEYILLVLSDSNLPTGGFVASSGLESYWAHGLLQTLAKDGSNASSSSASNQMIAFISASLDTYGHTIAAFLMDTHKIAYECMHSENQSVEVFVDKIVQIDLTLHTMMLNHVAQRASKAQGVALLTLYAKSFSPINISDTQDKGVEGMPAKAHQSGYTMLQQLKSRIRLGTCHGHLPICWAAFIAALGIRSSKKALAVHLFLQARAILSSAVRLNIVGPYLSHRLLAFEVKQIIEDTVKKVVQESSATLPSSNHSPINDHHHRHEGSELKEVKSSEFEWNWNDDRISSSCDNFIAPKTTWPLGDLLQGRHDQLHSRLFNS